MKNLWERIKAWFKQLDQEWDEDMANASRHEDP